MTREYMGELIRDRGYCRKVSLCKLIFQCRGIKGEYAWLLGKQEKGRKLFLYLLILPSSQK
jgi:hypothetical protein